jgi:hypothetical protein
MLLELLEHHEDLFFAAIEPLTLRRDRGTWSTLKSLFGTCKALYDVISEVPLWQHYRKWRMILRSTDIKKAIYACGRSDATILSVNNKIVVYYDRSVFISKKHVDFNKNKLCVYALRKQVSDYKGIKIYDVLPNIILCTTTIPIWLQFHPVLSPLIMLDHYFDDKLIDSIDTHKHI